MARYAIGDVQGCFDTLTALLQKLNYQEQKDELWFAGDLVNRGPKSLETLRFIKGLSDKNAAIKVVLGNHDLHLLACYYSKKAPKKKDTLLPILEAPDCKELMTWLKQQPLMVWDQLNDLVMTHAGLPHLWSLEKAFQLSQEVHHALQCKDLSGFFDAMYGNEPAGWSDELLGMARLRVITNYFTRMRFISPQGDLDFSAKEALDSAPDGFFPWFSFTPSHQHKLIFGHWAALEGKTGFGKQFQATDTGCVWGGKLTAINLDSWERTSMKSKEKKPALFR